MIENPVNWTHVMMFVMPILIGLVMLAAIVRWGDAGIGVSFGFLLSLALIFLCHFMAVRTIEGKLKEKLKWQAHQVRDRSSQR